MVAGRDWKGVCDEAKDFTYSGLGGRLSARATSIAGGANSNSTEAWTYNNLGLSATHGHPRFPNGTDSAALTETFTYSNGFVSLVSLAGKKIDNSSITAATITPEYTPAGTLKKYTAAQTGGVSQVTTITQDTNLLPRPSQISTSLGSFNTGTYSYDGAGNVLAMGSDNFKYDNRSRLISALYSGQSNTCTDSANNTGRGQCFAYDRWANLTGVTGTNPRPLTTSTSTNRLSTGATYDNRGNLLTFGGQTLTWDEIDRQRKDLTASVTWQYLYRGDPERLVRVPWWASAGPAVTRRETARYFVQGEGWAPSSGCSETPAPPNPGSRTFTDVHCADQDWQAIETFFDQGITAGCGGSNFCPDSPITRGQMMVFLLKVEHGSSYIPPACTGIFADVACPGGQFVDWIERAYNEGLTAGCGGSNFCPTGNVNEWQMAVYLNKPQISPTYRGIPGGSFYTLRDDQNRVITEFYESFPGRDNVYLGNLLAASYVSHANSGTLGWNFHSADHLGTVRLTVNGTSGSTIESLKYWPYGDRFGSTGVPLQKLAFASMERDGENNHYFDHARKHDFNLGRFVSPDQVGGRARRPQSWNRYNYARNNPLKYVDPNGRTPAAAVVVSNPGAWILGLAATWLYGLAYTMSRAPVFGGLPQPKTAADIATALSGSQRAGAPSVPFPGFDPAVSPGKEWEWRGKGEPGTPTGAWHNPGTGESLHPDLDHVAPVGPHWDYVAPDGSQWRVFPDGHMEPKDKPKEKEKEPPTPKDACAKDPKNCPGHDPVDN